MTFIQSSSRRQYAAPIHQAGVVEGAQGAAFIVDAVGYHPTLSWQKYHATGEHDLRIQRRQTRLLPGRVFVLRFEHWLAAEDKGRKGRMCGKSVAASHIPAQGVTAFVTAQQAIQT